MLDCISQMIGTRPRGVGGRPTSSPSRTHYLLLASARNMDHASAGQLITELLIHLAPLAETVLYVDCRQMAAGQSGGAAGE